MASEPRTDIAAPSSGSRRFQKRHATVSAAAGLLILSACATPVAPPQAEQPAAGPSLPAPAGGAAPQATPPAPAGTGAAAPRPAARPSPAGAPTSATTPTSPREELGQPFATRYARFEPVTFSSLPGWTADSVRESMEAFRQSCLALGKKPVWDELCAQAGKIAAGDDARIRAFFEERFYAYSMRNPDLSDEGVITGYYEPLLEGSRTRSPRYPYPVHGVPADLLFLDAQVAAAGRRQWLRLDDRRLTPVAPGTPGARQYDIELGGLTPGIRDKRYRVRIEGNRIVPYWTRQEIERRALDAQVLAWVNDPYALYSMQIQGSGRIRLASGEVVRVAYGEQNGHPFLPQASNAETATVGAAIKTRGLALGPRTAEASPQQAAQAPRAEASIQRDPEVAAIIAALQGRPTAAPAARPAPSPASAAPPTSPAGAPPGPGRASATDPEVAAIIAALSGKAPPPAPAPSPAAAAPASAATAAPGAGSVEPASGGAGRSTGIPDPSYVFFRLIPDGPHGPLGALGVPLTAGRSIAVDPRTTPLGYPVFVSAGDGTKNGNALNRLMFAQDTGGAIRGTVRADYFWGFGPSAGDRAARMKETGRMWLLLPRALQTPALATAVRTRALAGGPLPECVVPDPENCVED